MIQTHLHLDHTGAIGHFPDATFVVDARELDAALDAGDSSDRYIAGDFEHPDVRWQPIGDELDVYGDGCVRMVSSLGHSVGHMSLLLELPRTGSVLTTADAANTRRVFDGLDPPGANYSVEEAEASVDRLRTIARDTDALVIFGHDANEWPTLARVYE